MAENLKLHEGGCLSGGVRFKANGQSLRSAHCNCPICRKANGAAYASFVEFKKNQVSFVGTSLKEFKSS